MFYSRKSGEWLWLYALEKQQINHIFYFIEVLLNIILYANTSSAFKQLFSGSGSYTKKPQCQI